MFPVLSFPHRFLRRLAGLCAAGLAVGCSGPEPAPAAPPLPPPPVIVPAADPVPAPSAPAVSAPSTPRQPDPAVAMLAYAEKVRPLGNPELQAEIQRLGEPADPGGQMQLALVLAQTRVPADLARSLGLLQRVIANPWPEAQPLIPLARLLAARYLEQRRVEDDRDKQVQALRDSQRRIDQLNERLEALRAIERSFARPNNSAPAAAPAAPAAPATPPSGAGKAQP